MLFDDWAGIGRVLLMGVLAYAALIVILRVSGKRTLSKLNAFDLVVTVALGSILATIILSKDVALAEGIAALGVLVALQALISWGSVRSRKFQDMVKSEPALLVRNGTFLEGSMRANRITREEVLASLRDSGQAGLEGVAAVILETDGSISVVADATFPLRCVPDVT